MIVGKLDNRQLVIVDRLRDAWCALGGVCCRTRRPVPMPGNARWRACRAWDNWLRALPHHAVRAVGTNTMRQIRDGGAFLKAAEDALGHPIEVIGGREEARLVYLGVAHGLAPGDEDAPGGRHRRRQHRRSSSAKGCSRGPRNLFMGCVSMTGRFFADGKISDEAMERRCWPAGSSCARSAACSTPGQWRPAVGSSAR